MDLRDIKAKLILWMKYDVTHWRALAIFNQEGKKERTFTHPRYEILINPIQVS